MTPLSDAQKQLLFGYSFGMTGERDTAEAEQLLSSSLEAAQLCDLFKAALSPLDSVEPEPCPDDLAERTIARLREQARIVSGQGRLEQLLNAEQARVAPLRVPFWRNWTEVAAMAAAIILFLSVLVPAFGLARQKQWQTHCQTHSAGIYSGLANYVTDHDGRLPTVAMAPGAPWWKVGTQGPESPSNTRRAWLLVKQGYVPLSSFVCPARPNPGRPDPDTVPVAQYNDFPARSFIHFSVRIDGPQAAQPTLGRKRVFLADLNPLSEEFPRDLSTPASIELRDSLLTANSRNHRQRGQNVLFCDGSVEFTRTRRTSLSDDDIYTLQAMSRGQRVSGTERPASDSDTFVAP
jgi:prepilin-type processing-associated H-X9-DG protein